MAQSYDSEGNYPICLCCDDKYNRDTIKECKCGRNYCLNCIEGQLKQYFLENEDEEVDDEYKLKVCPACNIKYMFHQKKKINKLLNDFNQDELQLLHLLLNKSFLL